MTDQSHSIKSICVYCGSRPGRDAAYMTAGRTLGKEIAEYGLRLIYGGGTKGIMGAVASGVLSAGGQVTGIIPEFLIDMEATRHSLGQLNELIVTPDMHARKHMMFERSDAFVALPGGIGTLEEIVEIMTWAQLARHEKPMVFANINGFWDPMMELLKLSTIGIMQYIAPTMIFLIAVFVFHEPLGTARMIAFPLLWAGLFLYSWSMLKGSRGRCSAKGRRVKPESRDALQVFVLCMPLSQNRWGDLH